MFITFAQLFPDDVNGVLKNVESSLAIKLRRQAQDAAKSSPGPSPSGSQAGRRPSTAPGGAAPAAASGTSRSIRFGAAPAAASAARRPSKLNTAPSTESAARPRPPSLSPKPAPRPRASLGGSRLHSESSNVSSSSAFSRLACPENLLCSNATTQLCLSANTSSHFHTAYPVTIASLPTGSMCHVLNRSRSKTVQGAWPHSACCAGLSSNSLSLEGTLGKYAKAKESNETLSWSTAVSLCEGVMHALERSASGRTDCHSLLRPHMTPCAPPS